MITLTNQPKLLQRTGLDPVNRVGWQCPVCKTCYHPEIKQCECAVKIVEFWVSGCGYEAKKMIMSEHDTTNTITSLLYELMNKMVPDEQYSIHVSENGGQFKFEINTDSKTCNGCMGRNLIPS